MKRICGYKTRNINKTLSYHYVLQDESNGIADVMAPKHGKKQSITKNPNGGNSNFTLPGTGLGKLRHKAKWCEKNAEEGRREAPSPLVLLGLLDEEAIFRSYRALEEHLKPYPTRRDKERRQ